MLIYILWGTWADIYWARTWSFPNSMQVVYVPHLNHSVSQHKRFRIRIKCSYLTKETYKCNLWFSEMHNGNIYSGDWVTFSHNITRLSSHIHVILRTRGKKWYLELLYDFVVPRCKRNNRQNNTYHTNKTIWNQSNDGNSFCKAVISIHSSFSIFG